MCPPSIRLAQRACLCLLQAHNDGPVPVRQERGPATPREQVFLGPWSPYLPFGEPSYLDQDSLSLSFRKGVITHSRHRTSGSQCLTARCSPGVRRGKGELHFNSKVKGMASTGGISSVSEWLGGALSCG